MASVRASQIIRQSLVIAIALICIVCMLTAENGDLVAVGLVVERKGKWIRVQEKKVLEPYDEVFPRTTLQTEASTTNSIKIAFFDGRVWSQTCSVQDPCGRSYNIPSATKAKSALMEFLKNYVSAQKLVPPVFTASRGVGSVGPREAVLVARSGTVNLATSLDGTAAGRWRLTLTNPSASLESGTTRIVDWPGEVSANFGDLAPGVYALDVRNESGEPLGSPAAVLLVTPTAAAKAQEEFNQAKELASRWQGVDSATQRGFLVRVLYAIELETKI